MGGKRCHQGDTDTWRSVAVRGASTCAVKAHLAGLAPAQENSGAGLTQEARFTLLNLLEDSCACPRSWWEAGCEAETHSPRPSTRDSATPTYGAEVEVIPLTPWT